MLGVGTGLANDMQRVLKWDLLVRAGVIKQGNCRADGFKVQIADGIFQLAEKSRERGAVGMRLSCECTSTWSMLITRFCRALKVMIRLPSRRIS